MMHLEDIVYYYATKLKYVNIYEPLPYVKMIQFTKMVSSGFHLFVSHIKKALCCLGWFMHVQTSTSFGAGKNVIKYNYYRELWRLFKMQWSPKNFP